MSNSLPVALPGPPGGAWDVLLFDDARWRAWNWAKAGEGSAESPLRDPVPLGPDAMVTVMSSELEQRVFDACSLREELPTRRVRQFDQLFTWIREIANAGVDAASPWDPEQRLQLALLVSRLVRWHPGGLMWSARIRFDMQGGIQSIVPGPCRGTGRVAYGPPLSVDDESRGWLDIGDLAATDGLIRAVDRIGGWSALPPRLRRALRLTEQAMWSSDKRVRVLLLSAAWECLTTIGERETRWQFVRRGTAMAMVAGFPTFDVRAAQDAYTVRGCVVHGGDVPPRFVDEEGSESAAYGRAERAYVVLEGAIRATLRAAVVGDDMRRAFATNDALRARFPAQKST